MVAVGRIALIREPRLTAAAVMNVHHLELFYYVARHGGISSAVRHMPYGIQQPAVSAQILLLEKDLGVKLFDRQPFRLTSAGQQLMEFADRFFSNLEAIAHRLRNGAQPQLRVSASEVVLRTHFPAVLERLSTTIRRCGSDCGRVSTR